MAITLRLGDETFEIPVPGSGNWGEQVTLYLQKNSEIIATIQGPQDILLTEAPLVNGATNQPIVGLSFDTSTLQQIKVEGIITRTFTTSADPKVDSFTMEGIFDGSNFHIQNEYVGTDAGVSLNINGAGQATYTAETVADTDTFTIRFRAKAIVED